MQKIYKDIRIHVYPLPSSDVNTLPDHGLFIKTKKMILF